MRNGESPRELGTRGSVEAGLGGLFEHEPPSKSRLIMDGHMRRVLASGTTESPSGGGIRRSLAAAVAVLTIGALVAVSAPMLTAPPARSLPPVAGVGLLPAGRETHRFGSLPEMVAAADAFAVVTITAAEPSRSVDRDRGPETTRSVSVEVAEVLFGDLGAQMTLVVDELYWDERLSGTAVDWLAPGTRVALALHQRTDTGAYRPLNTQSIFIVNDDERLLAVWRDSFTETLSGLTLSDLRARVADAES
jgi:hypothetical protein